MGSINRVQTLFSGFESAPTVHRAPCSLKGIGASFFLILFAISQSASAQEVLPQPAGADDQLRLTMVLDVPSCFNEIVDIQLNEYDDGVVVVYFVESVEDPICATPPPLRLDVELGSFQPGRYNLRIEGTFYGDPRPAITSIFVVGSGLASTRQVPSASASGLFILVVILFIFGAFNVRSRC
jgi:hypothetical protein